MRVAAFQTVAGEEWMSPDLPPPGQALAKTIRDRLRAAGAECDEVDLHEEYGWAWLQKAEGINFYVLLIQYAGLADQWLLQVNAQRRFPFFTRPTRPTAESKVCQQIQAVLESSDEVDRVRWFDTLSQVSNASEAGRKKP
jgi:hypothetical protein